MTQGKFDYADYLAIKKNLDDRSLNPDVWKAFSQWLIKRQQEKGILQILEIGAGIGTMIIRLLDSGLLKNCVYKAIEIQPEFRETARSHIQAWCHANACQIDTLSDTRWKISKAESCVEVQWFSADVLQVEQLHPPASFDLLVGHAFIDLLPVPAFLPQLLDRLVPQGICYFTINYAGETEILPLHELDDSVLAAYHQDMDRRFPDLDWTPSQTGRQLGAWLQQHGCRILAEGVSDWRLSPTADPNDDSHRFVANILDTIESALPTMAGVPPWLDNRRRQLQAGKLQFRAANRDVLALSDKQSLS